jgi:hypothetical protein
VLFLVSEVEDHDWYLLRRRLKMFAKRKTLFGFATLLLAQLVTQRAEALSVTQTGTFAADNSVSTYNFNVAAAQPYVLWTTSYGGGTNLDGTNSPAGGFVPVLTLYSADSGNVVANDGAGGTCSPVGRQDASTGVCDDAYIFAVLTPGNYVLDLTEFPNVAIGNLSDGFLFSTDPTATGDACSGGMFVQADLSSCPQRTNSYAFNVASVPEPATVWLVVPGLALAGLFRYRRRVGF